MFNNKEEREREHLSSFFKFTFFTVYFKNGDFAAKYQNVT